jgi:hypothetical protein
MRLIVDTYDRPTLDFRNKADRQNNVDVLRAFSEACREDLRVFGIRQPFKFPGVWLPFKGVRRWT